MTNEKENLLDFKLTLLSNDLMRFFPLPLLALLALCVLCSSCETSSERVPVPPQSNSSTTPWNQMQKFEQNAIFGNMNQRR